MINLEIAIAPVNNGTGELTVVFRSGAREPLRHVKIECYIQGDEEGNRLMSVIPPRTLGYVEPELRAEYPPRSYPFTLKPIRAETGKTYRAVVQVSHVNGDGDRVLYEEDAIDVRLEPRPEIYFAIGIADTVREKGLSFYREMIEAGKVAHDRTDTVLPDFGTNDEPIKTMMGEETFRWAMSMVELGSRIYNSQAKK